MGVDPRNFGMPRVDKIHPSQLGKENPPSPIITVNKGDCVIISQAGDIVMTRDLVEVRRIRQMCDDFLRRRQ